MYRHQCDQGDNLEQYGWREHDGRNFGVQVIVDKFIQLETSFVTRLGGNHGGDWTARIQVLPRVNVFHVIVYCCFFLIISI